jgi:hypothetical protein
MMSTYYVPLELVGGHYGIAREWLRSGLEPIAEADLLNELESAKYVHQEHTVFFDGALRRLTILACNDAHGYSYLPVNRDGTLHSRQPDSTHIHEEHLEPYFDRVYTNCAVTEAMLPEQRSQISVDYMERQLLLGDNDSRSGAHADWRQLTQMGRVLLVGEPGAGKTTLLRRIAIGLVRIPFDAPDFALPVYLQLREWQPDCRLDRLVRHELSHLIGGDFDNGFPELAASGRMIFLFDGLDEIPTEWRSEAFQEIVSFIEHNSTCRYIISTRPTAKPSGRALELEEVTIPDLSEAQIQELCWRRLPETKSPWTHFWNRLCSEPDIAAIAKNPLLLTLLIARFVRDSLSPHFAGEVVLLALEALTDGWDSVRGVRRTTGSSLSPKVALSVLKRLAAMMGEKSETTLSDSDCSRLLSDMAVPKPPLILLTEIEAASGLIRRTKSHRWEFSHLAFRDYLQAASVTETLAQAAATDRQMSPSLWRYICSEAHDASGLLTRQTEGPYHSHSIELAASAMTQRLVVSRNVIRGFCLSALWLLDKLVGRVTLTDLQPDARAEQSDMPAVMELVTVAESELDLLNLYTFVAILRRTRDGYASTELGNRLKLSSNDKIRLLTPFLLAEGRLEIRRGDGETDGQAVFTLVRS